MRFAISLLILLAFVLVTVHLASGIIQATPPIPTPAVPTATAHPELPRGGSVTAALGGNRWRLTLTGFARHHQITDAAGTVTAQGIFALVYLTAQNLSRDPHILATDAAFALRDGQGRTWDPSPVGSGPATAASGRVWDLAVVEPTFGERIVLCFDVARDARDLVLRAGSTLLGLDARDLWRLPY